MATNQRVVKILSVLLVGGGVVLLALNIILGKAVNITLPLVFLMLGGAFYLLVSFWKKVWIWAPILYIPGSILFALGIIFFFNVITSDWNAWAYAWLLILTGIGLGVALANGQMHWRQEFSLAGVGLIIVSITLFAVFGAIAGGAFIQVTAPVLLVLGGLALFWLKPDLGLPGSWAQRLQSPSTPSADPILRSPDQTQLVEPLSSRELEVLYLINQGLSNPEIAAKLTLANSTVKTHINNIYGKLGVQTRVQALKRAQELKLIE